MLTTVKRQSRRALSLGALEEQYFSGGIEAARAAFERMVDKGNNWAVIKPEKGTSSRRTDLSENAGISYLNYSPPAFWQPPYAVLRATLDSTPQKNYVSHAGEEIVVPIKGKVHFHVFWSPGGKRPDEKHFKEIGFGSVLRLNPEVPHHAWGVGQQAEAWLLIRHASNTETAVSRDFDVNPSTRTKYHKPTRILKAEDLRKMPGRYALMAWGLAAKIKSYRERADLTIKRVAEACGVDHANISRLENGDINISLEMLLRIATYLRVDIGEFFTTQPWDGYIEDLKPSQFPARLSPCHFTAPSPRHLLHATSLCIPQGATENVPYLTRKESEIQIEDMVSCIVMSGRLIAKFGDAEEILGPGAVMHLRSRQTTTIEALNDSVLLQTIYSRATSCPCLKPKKSAH